MKIQCSSCELAEATVMCCADEAALCSACDEKVHAANKLAGKHQRVPLLTGSTSVPKCDICQEVSAYFFCLEDRAVLCRQCDVSVHSTNPYVSSHQRFLLTGVRVGLESFKPIAYLDKEQSESTQRSLEPPMDLMPYQSLPLSLSIDTNAKISGQEGKDGDLTVNKTPFSGITMAGTMPDWPLDKFYGFTDFNQTLGFTEHAFSKVDALNGSSERSAFTHTANGEMDGDESLVHVPEIPWSSPEIPSPATASELSWLKDVQFPESENEMFVPDISSFEDPNSPHSAVPSLKRRRPWQLFG